MARFEGMKHLRPWLMPIVLVLITGCASYSIERLKPVSSKDWGNQRHNKGFLFYQPELYFILAPEPPKDTNAAAAPKPKQGTTADQQTEEKSTKQSGQPQYSVKAVYLPNYKKPYKVSTFNFLAKSDFTFSFADGWQLTAISDKSDNTTVANSVVGQLKTILTAAGAGFLPGRPEEGKAFLLHPQYGDDGIITGFDAPVYVPATAGQ